MISSEFFENFQNNFSIEHLQTVELKQGFTEAVPQTFYEKFHKIIKNAFLMVSNFRQVELLHTETSGKKNSVPVAFLIIAYIWIVLCSGFINDWTFQILRIGKV